MKHVNKLIDGFFVNYPQASTGNLSVKEMNRLLAEHQEKINGRPEKDFDGISRQQMFFLLNDPMGEKSLIQFHAMPEASLGQVPLLSLSDLLLRK